VSAGPGTRAAGDGPVLRFGFTYEHVQALAWSAVRRHARSAGMDASVRSKALALLVLAEHDGDHQAAAAALRVSGRVLERQLWRARVAFLAAWHEHEAPPRCWRRDQGSCRRVRRSQPASPAEAARALADIAGAFGGDPRVAGAELLPRLKAADPGRWPPERNLRPRYCAGAQDRAWLPTWPAGAGRALDPETEAGQGSAPQGGGAVPEPGRLSPPPLNPEPPD